MHAADVDRPSRALHLFRFSSLLIELLLNLMDGRVTCVSIADSLPRRLRRYWPLALLPLERIARAAAAVIRGIWNPRRCDLTACGCLGWRRPHCYGDASRDPCMDDLRCSVQSCRQLHWLPSQPGIIGPVTDVGRGHVAVSAIPHLRCGETLKQLIRQIGRGPSLMRQPGAQGGEVLYEEIRGGLPRGIAGQVASNGNGRPNDALGTPDSPPACRAHHGLLSECMTLPGLDASMNLHATE